MLLSFSKKLHFSLGARVFRKHYIPSYCLPVIRISYYASNSNAKLHSWARKSYHFQDKRRFLAHAGYVSKNKLYSSELEEFNAVGKIIKENLIECDDSSLIEAMDWCSKVFAYNLKHGKKNRGTAVLKSYQILSTYPTSEGFFSACILGWCVEMLQAFFLISDDIMDESNTRRGELCWYKKPEVGLVAINDGLMLQCGIYKILKKHFLNQKFYFTLVHEFHKVTENTVYGQCLDMLSNPLQGKPNYTNFTIEKYKAIVEYKTSHYTYCLPVHLAMHLIGNESSQDFKKTTQLALQIGYLFQIQDDYLDCYGDPAVTGKLGTDIKQGKCSWFAVTFLQYANDALKKEWMENYGKDDEESISKVKDLYEKLNLRNKYLQFEQKLHSDISLLINNELTDKSMQEVFFYLLDKTYQREKWLPCINFPMDKEALTYVFMIILTNERNSAKQKLITTALKLQ